MVGFHFDVHLLKYSTIRFTEGAANYTTAAVVKFSQMEVTRFFF